MSLSFRYSMITHKWHMFFFLTSIVILFSWWFFFTAHAVQGTLNFEITGIWLRHGTPSNVNLWVIPTSTSDQDFSGQFSDYFWIEDLQWYITGHYTTIQCDGVYGSAGNTLTWVYLKAGDLTPTLVQWLSGNVHIASGLANYTSILNPITYFYKPTSNINAGIVNTYWDKPWLKILIPWSTPPWSYSGTIVFSFYSY